MPGDVQVKTIGIVEGRRCLPGVTFYRNIPCVRLRHRGGGGMVRGIVGRRGRRGGRDGRWLGRVRRTWGRLWMGGGRMWMVVGRRHEGRRPVWHGGCSCGQSDGYRW